MPREVSLRSVPEELRTRYLPEGPWTDDTLGTVVAAPDLEAVRCHLEAAGLARPKWPEELRVVDDFPRTPSGKIKKFVLRKALRAEHTTRTGR